MEAEKLLKKLQLNKPKRILIIDPPEEFTALIPELKFDTKPKGLDYEYIHIFANSQSDLEEKVARTTKYGKYDCLFWISYPKGISDIKRNTTWNAFEMAELRPVSQVSINKTWSAIRGRPKDMVGRK